MICLDAYPYEDVFVPALDRHAKDTIKFALQKEGVIDGDVCKVRVSDYPNFRGKRQLPYEPNFSGDESTYDGEFDVLVLADLGEDVEQAKYEGRKLDYNKIASGRYLAEVTETTFWDKYRKDWKSDALLYLTPCLDEAAVETIKRACKWENIPEEN